MTPAARNRQFVLLGAAITAALLARVSVLVLTDRVWEDALITLAHVRNAVEGFGLTHHVGEGPVHGFTSALSVLIPLGSSLLSEDSGLAAMRLASLVAGVLTVWYGWAIARTLGISMWGSTFVLGYLALNQLHVFYGMAGMETQVATAILLAGIHHVLHGQVLRAGLAAGLAVLARPEFGIWLLIVAAWATRRGARPLTSGLIPAVLVVAPWVVFTTLYYGSPVPHTIAAKSTLYSAIPDGAVPDLLGWAASRVANGLVAMLRAFMPFYEDGNVIAAPLPAGALSLFGLALIGLAVWGAFATRRVPNWWPPLGFMAIFSLYWLLFLPTGYFTWYLPPLTGSVALLVGAGIDRLRLHWPPLAAPVVIALLAGVVMHYPYAIPLDARVQTEIDEGVRREVGLYLAEHVGPGEAVVTEPAGYVGWYSRALLWDHPGLTSPTALAALRSLPPNERRVTGLVAVLDPPWAVLRPHEWDELRSRHPDAAACYSIAHTVGERRPNLVELNGLVRWNQDWGFHILQRDRCPKVTR